MNAPIPSTLAGVQLLGWADDQRIRFRCACSLRGMTKLGRVARCGPCQDTRHRDISRARSLRKRFTVSRTEELYRISAAEREQIRADAADYPDVQRPRMRMGCAAVPRPCPFVSCRWNLYLDISQNGRNLKLNFPDIEPGEMPANASCALDVADEGGVSLLDIGGAMNLTRERARQIEAEALAKIEKRLPIVAE